MGFFASIQMFDCPMCGEEVVATATRASKTEPGLAVVVCQNCRTELQISKDPTTGTTVAKKIRKQ